MENLATFNREAPMETAGGELILAVKSPHSPASPVGNVAAAHVCATMANFLILECAYGEVPWRSELLDPPEKIVDSALPLSDRPGFGVVLNDQTAARYGGRV